MNWIIERKLKTRRRQMRLNVLCFVCFLIPEAKAAERRKWNDNKSTDEKEEWNEIRRLRTQFTSACIIATPSDGKRKRELMLQLRVPNPTWIGRRTSFLLRSSCTPSTGIYPSTVDELARRTPSELRQHRDGWLFLFNFNSGSRRAQIEYSLRTFVISINSINLIAILNMCVSRNCRRRKSIALISLHFLSRPGPKFTSNVIYSCILLRIPFTNRNGIDECANTTWK